MIDNNLSYPNSRNKYLIYYTPFILYLFLLINGIAGAGFGEHWDEHAFLRPACESIHSISFLPHEYIYPSFCYYIILFAGWLYKMFTGISDARLLISSPEFYFYIRTIFICISSLSVIWVYFLSLKITKDYYSSLLAGLILCGSYELSYHFRWAVSDCIVMQFAALSVLILFLKIERRNKIIFSSLISGVCAGTKYTGGMILLNVLLFIIITSVHEKRHIKNILRELLLMGLFSLAGFLITTPGAVLENSKFIAGLKTQSMIYSTGHLGHTVDPGFDHFSKILLYTITEFFSGNDLLSILIFMLAFYGIIISIAQKKTSVICLFITLLCYVIFISAYKVMIVRNIMYLLPFFAVFASIGFHDLKNHFSGPRERFAFMMITGIITLGSCVLVAFSSYDLNRKDRIDLSAELNDYIVSHPEEKFVLSGKSCVLMNKKKDDNSSADNAYLLFFKNEVPVEFYKANIKGQFRDVIGVNDVNFDYYPTWSGKDRIIVMKYSDAGNDILKYTLKGQSTRILCNAENKKSDDIFDWAYDSGNADSSDEKMDFTGARLQSDEISYSGKFSVKQNCTNDHGFMTTLKLHAGNYYRFSVRRNSASGNGFLILGENNFYNRAWYPSEKNNGWEKICLDFYCSSENPELPLFTWLQDPSSSAYFDDLEIEIIK